MTLAVFHSADEWTAGLGPLRKRTVVTVGNFDGIHLGHQKILRGVIERARASGEMSAVLTFYPHPARVLRPAEAPSLLLTLDQRLRKIESMGVDAALVLRFDAKLAKVSAEDFARLYLVEALNACLVMVGANFRFGHKQSGDVKLLEKFGRDWDFDVHIVPPVEADGVIVSSSAVRQALGEGRVKDAAHLLGRPFTLAGEIRPGTGQGRKLVVPTLNLATEQECLPKFGVYATETVVGGKTYGSATNVGVRPTFDGQHVAIESHLFDFSKQLSAGSMEVRFLERLRDERKFAGPAELREQVLKDIAQAKKFFSGTPWKRKERTTKREARPA